MGARQSRSTPCPAERQQQLLSLEVDRDFVMWLQPIVQLETSSWIGLEALARFPNFPGGPAAVFAEAADLQIGVKLELTAFRAAIDQLADLPSNLYLAVNAGPETFLDPRLADIVGLIDSERIVLEVTEHALVADYPELNSAIHTLTSLRARLAIDDVGTGFSGLHQILELKPDMLKLDGALVRDIDTLPDKQAMVRALTRFARDSDATVIAEQVETAPELAMFNALNVTNAQGYHLTRPAPFDVLFPTTTPKFATV